MSKVVEPPASSPELAVSLCLSIAVLGDDPKVLLAAFANAELIAKHISTMDLSVVRLRGRAEDAKVREDFAKAAVWLGAMPSRYKDLGGF